MSVPQNSGDIGQSHSGPTSRQRRSTQIWSGLQSATVTQPSTQKRSSHTVPRPQSESWEHSGLTQAPVASRHTNPSLQSASCRQRELMQPEPNRASVPAIITIVRTLHLAAPHAGPGPSAGPDDLQNIPRSPTAVEVLPAARAGRAFRPEAVFIRVHLWFRLPGARGTDAGRAMAESTAGNRDLTFGAAVATAVLCLAFGANAPAVRLAVEGFGPLTMGGLRFAVGAVVITLWACVAREPLRLPWSLLRRLLLLSIAFLVQICFFYLGLARTYASRGTLIGNLQPFLVLFLAHFFLEGERITARRLLGMTLGFVGVAVVFADEASVVAQLRTGDLFVLVAVVIWSATTVVIKRIIDDYNPFQLSLYPMLVCAPAMLLGGALWDDPMIGELSARAVGGLAYQALLTASIGFVAWNSLFKRYGAVAMNSYLFLQPIAGVALGGLLLDEPVATVAVLLGLPLVVVGIVVVNWRPRTERSAP